MLDWQFGGALAAMLTVSALTTCLVYDLVFGLSVMGGDGGQHATGWIRRLGLVVIAVIANVTTVITEGLARLLGGHRFGWLLPAYATILIAD